MKKVHQCTKTIAPKCNSETIFFFLMILTKKIAFKMDTNTVGPDHPACFCRLTWVLIFCGSVMESQKFVLIKKMPWNLLKRCSKHSCRFLGILDTIIYSWINFRQNQCYCIQCNQLKVHTAFSISALETV